MMDLNLRFCEIRVPTYKRPSWLRDALLSLQSQTVRSWNAVVLDDDPCASALPVVEEISESRIIYKNTSSDRGCVQNLARAFQKQRYFEDSFYFSVLEDDNWYYPDFLEAGISASLDNNVNVVLLDQEVWSRAENNRSNTKLSTLVNVIPRGLVSPEFVRANLFLTHSISNGSLFWTADAISDFSVPSPAPFDSYIQEMQRALSLYDDVYVSTTAHSAWSDCSRILKYRSFESSRALMRGVRRLRKLALTSIPRNERHYWLESVYNFHKDRRNFERQLFEKEVVRSSGIHLVRSGSLSGMIIREPLQFFAGFLNL